MDKYDIIEIALITLIVVTIGLLGLAVWGAVSSKIEADEQAQTELVPDTTFTTDEGHVIKMYNGKHMIGDYDNPAYNRVVDSITVLVNIDSVVSNKNGTVFYYKDPDGNLQQGIKPNFIDSLPRLERIGITQTKGATP